MRLQYCSGLLLVAALLAGCPVTEEPVEEPTPTPLPESCQCPEFEPSLGRQGGGAFGDLEHESPDPYPARVCPDCIELVQLRASTSSYCNSEYTVYLDVTPTRDAYDGNFSIGDWSYSIPETAWEDLRAAMTDPELDWRRQAGWTCGEWHVGPKVFFNMWGRQDDGALWATQHSFPEACFWFEDWDAEQPGLEHQWRVVEALMAIYDVTMRERLETEWNYGGCDDR
jgi:hypothetical protein